MSTAYYTEIWEALKTAERKVIHVGKKECFALRGDWNRIRHFTLVVDPRHKNVRFLDRLKRTEVVLTGDISIGLQEDLAIRFLLRKALVSKGRKETP